MNKQRQRDRQAEQREREREREITKWQYTLSDLRDLQVNRRCI